MKLLRANDRNGWLALAMAVGALVCACSRALCAEAGAAEDASRREELVGRSLAALPDGVRMRLDEGGSDKVPVLLEVLRDPKTPASVIRPVVEILGHLRDGRAVEALGAILEATPSSSVRRSAIWALGQVKGPKAVERLVPLLNHEKSVVRRQGAVAIASALIGPGIDDPAGLLADGAPRLEAAGQMEVLRIIDRLDPPESALRALLRLLSRGRLATRVSRECIKLVGGARYTALRGVYKGLRDALRDENSLVRGEAAVVLARMHLTEDQREEITPDLLEQLGLEDETGKGRALIVRALARLTSEGRTRNAYEWRVWGVQEGYEDLGRPVPPEDYEPPVPTVAPGPAPTAEPGSPLYTVLGAGFAVLLLALLFARSAVGKGLAQAVGAGRLFGRRPRRREKRAHARMRAEVPVRYRYLGHDRDFSPTDFFQGTTIDVSTGGMQLAATVPDPSWLARLREGNVFFGVELRIPGEKQPVRAYARAKWVRPIAGIKRKSLVGLAFSEITKYDQDRVQRFVLDLGMT